MRLAFITHEPFYPPSGGGSAEAIYLVEEFVARGHEVHIFCPVLANLHEVEARFRVRIHPFTAWEMGRYTSGRNLKYLLYPAFLTRLVQRAARQTPFDLVFAQHAISAVAAGWLKKRLRVPVVMNFLDYLTGFMETWPPYLAPPPLLRRLMRFELSLPSRYSADAVLTVSDVLADKFAAQGYPRSRLLPIYYGFDSELFPLSASERSPAKPPVIVMHGSLDHHHLRGIAHEAVRHVSANCPGAVFKIVGHRTGALEQFVRGVESECPSARFELTGFVPYAEVARHLATATVGIVPYEESVGTHCAFVAKIVEYLAVGLPVVSTPLQSAMRYFNDEPRVRFARFNGIDFAEKITDWIAEAPGELNVARASSERVRRELDWRAISRKAANFAESVSTSPSGLGTI